MGQIRIVFVFAVSWLAFQTPATAQPPSSKNSLPDESEQPAAAPPEATEAWEQLESGLSQGVRDSFRRVAQALLDRLEVELGSVGRQLSDDIVVLQTEGDLRAMELNGMRARVDRRAPWQHGGFLLLSGLSIAIFASAILFTNWRLWRATKRREQHFAHETHRAGRRPKRKRQGGFQHRWAVLLLVVVAVQAACALVPLEDIFSPLEDVPVADGASVSDKKQSPQETGRVLPVSTQESSGTDELATGSISGQLRQLGEMAAVHLGVLREHQQLADRISDLHAEQQQLGSRLAVMDARQQRHGARFFALMAVSWLGFWWYAVSVTNRARQYCPKCGHRGAFSRIPGSSKKYRCSAKWFELAESEEEASPPCGMTLDASERKSHKLYFPLVGNGITGKSVWLSALYQSVLLRRFERGLDMKRTLTAKSTASDPLSKALERVRSQGPDAVQSTVRELPDPVIFDVTDRDFWMPGRVLVNVADYAGEVFEDLDGEHPLRLRMLRADGILLFIDLIELQRAATDSSADPLAQYKAIDLFFSEAKKLNCNAPAAVCLTKIDALLTDDRRGIVKPFYDKIENDERHRPPGRTRLSLVEKRHDSTCKLVDDLCGVNLRDRLDNDVVGGYKFFPVTSYGFNRPYGPGPIKPWGELEPFLWLLHMNGYSVFADS